MPAPERFTFPHSQAGRRGALRGAPFQAGGEGFADQTENGPVTESHAGFWQRLFQSQPGVTPPASISPLHGAPEMVELRGADLTLRSR